MERKPMATTTFPESQSRRRGRWLIGGGVLLALALVAVASFGVLRRPAPSAAAATVAVTRGSITASVVGSGTVAAEQALDLAPQTSGRVTAVLVKAGDNVQSGQVLARLDDRAL